MWILSTVAPCMVLGEAAVRQGSFIDARETFLIGCFLMFTSPNPTLRPDLKARKPCIPRPLPGSHKEQRERHLAGTTGHPECGASPRVVSSAVFGQVAWAGWFSGRLEARVAYILVRHFHNADLPFSKTKVSNLRYQYSNRA